MTMHSLPDYLPELNDPARNLAGLAAGLVVPPGRRLYRAWDGTPIGYSNDCDPITDEPYLSGLDGGYIRAVVPDVLSENRIEWGDDFAVPLMIGSVKFFQNRKPLQAALWALAGYMAPYGVALVVAVQAYQASGGRVPGFSEIPGVRSQTVRRCYRFKQVRSKKTGKPRKVCDKYIRLPV